MLISDKESYSQIHRNMTKDIILGFNDFFIRIITAIPEKDINYLLKERFTAKQWKYINKLVEESK